MVLTYFNFIGDEDLRADGVGVRRHDGAGIVLDGKFDWQRLSCTG